MTDPRRPAVVLVGPPGAGKSTIGRKLAKELGVDLYDTDAGIEADTGRTIPEIFATDGEPEFRRIEERIVRHAVQTHAGVVSLGGGAVLSADTRELLRGRTVVYLEISVTEGLRRTGNSTNRPLLAVGDPDAKYKELMRIRRPLYREVASVRVRTDGRSPGRVVRSILTKLGIEPRPESETTANTGSSARRPARRRRGRSEAAAVKTVETGTAVADADSPPRRRRSRRGGRNRSGAAKSPVTETNSATDATEAAVDVAASGDTTAARSTRSRRSRSGRGRNSGRTPAAEPAGGEVAAPATPLASGAVVAVVDPAPQRSPEPGPRSRRRSASRPAGAPTVHSAAPSPAESRTGRSSGGEIRTAATDVQPTGGDASPTTDGAASVSGGDARAVAGGPTASPSSGRSRRARARRARSRIATAPQESETRTHD